MIAGLDSAYPPNAASLVTAHAAGVRLWAGYFAGRNILNGWARADFDRVKAAGLSTLAFCSGWSDPAAIKAQAAAWGVPVCLDVEGGIRGFGPWVQAWLDASDAGLYANPPYHAGIRAAFHVVAAYPGYNPNASWPSNMSRPPTPCGWQWQGTHSAYGARVDSAWYDDTFLSLHGGSSGTLTHTEDDMTYWEDSEARVFATQYEQGKLVKYQVAPAEVAAALKAAGRVLTSPKVAVNGVTDDWIDNSVPYGPAAAPTQAPEAEPKTVSGTFTGTLA